ncbi:MAG: hypothetical protein J6563_02085 [Gilliamella sp.]|uniref:putative type VI secretion system effector n=1 Tax=Gilliamella sp. TaxID=1891236 RepID=UPI00262595F9|nr:putative type VI secretion system effector [Gilliamella sp.]MCO6551748.1 hypothetical protein [Gilliamella sp.]
MEQNIGDSHYYQIITGYITDLEVYDTQESYLNARKLAGCPDVNLRTIGHLDLVSMANSMKINAAKIQNIDYDTADIEQYFCCKLGDKVIEGVFCRTFFNEGDYVEAVVDPLAGGSYFAYALRRPADKLLWLHPYATEGTEAGNSKLNIPILPRIFLIGAGGLGAFTFFYFVVMAFSKNNFSLLLMAAMGLLFILPTYLFSSALKKSKSGSAIADKIFATLGYSNPKTFDIEKEYNVFVDKLFDLYKQYCENHNGYLATDEDTYNEFIDHYIHQQSEDDSQDDILLKQYLRQTKKIDGIQWAFFYVNTPAIPSYINVIHTENHNDNHGQ